MKKIKKISLIVILTLLIIYIQPISIANNVRNDKVSEVFYDDFSNDTLDSSKWLIAEKAWGGNNGRSS